VGRENGPVPGDEQGPRLPAALAPAMGKTGLGLVEIYEAA